MTARPPESLARSVLAAALGCAGAGTSLPPNITKIIEQPECLDDLRHQEIAGALRDLLPTGRPADLLSVSERCTFDGAYLYLDSLVRDVPTIDCAEIDAADLLAYYEAHQPTGNSARAEYLPAAAEATAAADGETYDHLAKLSPAAYDRAREAEADRLGIRVATLDVEVLRRRSRQDADGALQGGAVDLPAVVPWPEPVDGAAVLDEVADTLAGYVVLPPGGADAIALWISHAHCYALGEHSPRLSLASPEKGCGKTLCLDVIGSLVPCPLRTESLTPAVLFRLVQAHQPTLLLDEVDSYLADNDELRGLLNAGHRRGARAYRCEGDGHEVRAFSAYAPAALAGIGHLPGTLHDRSVMVRLARAKPGEVRERWDSRHVEREHELARKLARWAADHAEALAACNPVLPAGAYNRLADNWRPLCAIADVAGGDWPRRVAEAFMRLTSADDQDAQGVGTLLLADMADIFAAAGTDRLPSAVLAERLAQTEGRPWAEWGRAHRPISPNQVAGLLRRFGVVPHVIRVSDGTPRGYEVSDLKEVWERYLPGTPSPDRNNATTTAGMRDSAVSGPQQAQPVLHFCTEVSPRKNGPCCGVAFQKPPSALMEDRV